MAQDRADPETVSAFLAGDQTATKEIEALIRAVFRHWERRFGYETDDILSDARLELFESFRRGDFKYQSSLKAYIRPFVNHTCIDYLRLRNRWKLEDVDTLDLPDDRCGAEESLARKQEAKIAFRVLRQMPEECQQMWRMKLSQGLSCRQMGDILNKSEGNIRRMLWACRDGARKIREKITKRDKLLCSPNAKVDEGGNGWR